MLSKFKDAATTVMSKNASKESGKEGEIKPEKYCYARPYFLDLDSDEIRCAQDFALRPVIKPRNIEGLPLCAGYAECINGGKSENNEDNSYACVLRIRSIPNGKVDSPAGNNLKQWLPHGKEDLNAVYFGLFDGHAGYQTSLIVSRILHQLLQDRLHQCLDLNHQLLEDSVFYPCDITVDDLVTGALEEAFQDMDERLVSESQKYFVKGGCTALVVLMFEGKIYIANAGDSRAVLCHGKEVKQITKDFSPVFEKQRINLLGYEHPELLQNEFTCYEFPKRLSRTDLGKTMLCRKPGRNGWSYKKVEEQDLKFPIVTGEGKKSRLLGTIGVSRGLGDHDLYVYDTKIWIKPFLSCKPEVSVIDADGITDWRDDDILIIGTDGIWEVMKNEEVAEIVREEFSKSDQLSDKKCLRYTIAAQELVCQARGNCTGFGWKKSSGETASFDDITVFVIPIRTYLKEWRNGELSKWGLTSLTSES